MKHKRRAVTVGDVPGTLRFVGERKQEHIRIQLINYNEDIFEKREIESAGEYAPFITSETVSWINVDGLHDTGPIREIGDLFSIHPLLLEDIVNTEQRPKVEEAESLVMIVLKMLMYDNEMETVESEQVSLIVKDRSLISFQEKEGDVFSGIRERLEKNRGRIRKMGADYLAYSLIDAIVDNYFLILEKLGARIENMEDAVLNDVDRNTAHEIHRLKRELFVLRRSIWPLRDVIGTFLREEIPVFGKQTLLYMKDVQDHILQIIDWVEMYRDLVSGLLDTHLSNMSNRMNAVMKVLTIIATIFIPLTFIAGIYGMNFNHMPELGYRLGYPIVLLSMGAIGAAMVVVFKLKKWL